MSTAAVVIYVLAKAEILKAANAVNPLNPNNIFNKIGRASCRETV